MSNCLSFDEFQQRILEFVETSPFLSRRQIIFQYLGFVRRWFSFGGRLQRLAVRKDFYRFIKRVALHRRSSGFANGFDHVRFGLQLRRGRSGHVKDVFLDDCAVQIVRAVAQRHLREFQSEADPIRRDVIKVVEVNAADGDGS